MPSAIVFCFEKSVYRGFIFVILYEKLKNKIETPV